VSDPIITLRLREVELDYILNAAPEPQLGRSIEQLLSDRYVETVLDLIDDATDPEADE
jgi:hypothetical protein